MSACSLVVFTISFIPLSCSTDTLLTPAYGTPGGRAYTALNQGRIATITSWGIDDFQLKINAWSAESQTKFDEYGTGMNTDWECSPFTLSETDYITGYKIYIHEGSICGLRFYTLQSYTYSCIADYFAQTYFHSYITDQHNFYYLSGWNIQSGAIIDEIQFQFTQLSLSEPNTNPTNYPSPNPTYIPSMYLSQIPTENPSISPSNSPTNIPSIFTTVSTVNLTQKTIAKPTMKPSEFQTLNPTNNPTLEHTIQSTMNPTQTPTEKPTNKRIYKPTYLLEGEANEPTIHTTAQINGVILSENTNLMNESWSEIAMIIIGSILCLIWTVCMGLFLNIIHIKCKHKRQRRQTDKTVSVEQSGVEGNMEYDIKLQIDTMEPMVGITNGFSDTYTSDEILLKRLPYSENEETDDGESSNDAMYDEPCVNVASPGTPVTSCEYIDPNVMDFISYKQTVIQDQFVD